MAFVPALPLTRGVQAAAATPLRMSASEPQPSVSRRSLLTGAVAAAAAAALSPIVTNAEIEYPNVGFLGGSDQIDVNNANIRAYIKYPGMYPSLAGIIVGSGPFKSVDEIYELPNVTADMKKILDKYKDNLVVLEAAPEYEIDKYNNGLYR